MNRQDVAGAVNNLTAAMINVERLYTAASDPGLRVDLSATRQDIKDAVRRLRRCAQESAGVSA